MNVVDALRSSAAVLTSVIVASEDRPPVERSVAFIGDFHEVAEPNDRGNGNPEMFAAQVRASVGEDIDLLAQCQHHCSPARDHPYWFVGRIEYQGTRHGQTVVRVAGSSRINWANEECSPPG